MRLKNFMDAPHKLLPLGTFITVGDCVGVVIGWPDGSDIPEEHYAVWYGETSSTNLPRCRTVPLEYCRASTEIEYYH